MPLDVFPKRSITMDAEKLRVARDKLTRVFRYLEALNQHRNPAKRQIHEQPWSFWLRELPEHTSIRRGAAKASALKAKGWNGGQRGYGGRWGELRPEGAAPALDSRTRTAGGNCPMVRGRVGRPFE